jgi:hypothetical protein
MNMNQFVQGQDRRIDNAIDELTDAAFVDVKLQNRARACIYALLGNVLHDFAQDVANSRDTEGIVAYSAPEIRGYGIEVHRAFTYRQFEAEAKSR